MKTYKQIMVGVAAVAAMVGTAQAASYSVGWEVYGMSGASGVGVTYVASTNTAIIPSGSISFPDYTSSYPNSANPNNPLLEVNGDSANITLQKGLFWPTKPVDSDFTFTETIKFWITSGGTGQDTKTYSEEVPVTWKVNPNLVPKPNKNGYDVVSFGNADPITFNLGGVELILTPTSTTFTPVVGKSSAEVWIQADIAIVPEPYQYGLVSMFGLFGLAALDRIRQRRLVG